MDDPPALELRSVSKRYRLRDGGELAAVDSLSLEVRRGEIVALLGPNGAGKTTAMQLALGLLHPDAGEARLFGGHPEVLATRRRIGYAPDAPLFPKELTGLEVLALHGELLGFARREAKARAGRFAGEVGIGEPARLRTRAEGGTPWLMSIPGCAASRRPAYRSSRWSGATSRGSRQ